MFDKRSQLDKELEKLEREERSFLRRRTAQKAAALERAAGVRLPSALQDVLDTTFARAFTILFENGMNVIDKTYRKETHAKNYKINEYALSLKDDKKSWRAFSRRASATSNRNLLLSGASGIGLGAFGIGLPDIVLFTGLMLRSVYEIAIHYGYDHRNEDERRFILLVIRGALSRGVAFEQADAELNAFIDTGMFPAERTVKENIRQTSATMARELLYSKFLQGSMVIGAVGGMFDAVYMGRINRYAQLKYRRRFLAEKKLR